MKPGSIVVKERGGTPKRMEWRGMTGPDEHGRHFATLAPTTKTGKKRGESRVLECDASGLPHGYRKEAL